jgi:hypothetical protein
MPRTSPTWPVAAGSLVAGFAVAQATGIRAIGGVVLVAGCGWCALRWREQAGAGRAAGLVGIYLAAFAGSHGLALLTGPWPAVAIAAAVAGGSTWALADQPRVPQAAAGA